MVLHPLIVDSVGRWTRTYDPLDRTRSSQNPYGLTLTFTWAAASQRKALIDPAAGRLTYAYDPAGRRGGMVS